MTPTRSLLASLIAACLCQPAQAQQDKGWLATWTTASLPLDNTSASSKLPIGRQDVTLRQIVHISQGGKRLRITFTNEFGTTPLHIAAAHVAFLSAGSKILPATDRALTFNGHADVTIAPGTFIASDPVKATIPIFSDLVISAALPAQPIPRITYHGKAEATTFLAPGDATAAVEFNAPGAVPPGLRQPDVTAPVSAALGSKPVVAPTKPQPTGAVESKSKTTESTSWYFLKNLEVDADRKSGAVVTFGDSITDGDQSTPETNRRYPDGLAPLLAANKKTSGLSVLNAGISGNRILHEGSGPDALDRFDRDVATQPGARFVILLEGVNDIGHSSRAPEDAATADTIIAGMKTIAQRAHAHGLKIFAGTLLPCGGSKYDTAEAEQMIQQVNTYLRSGEGFDGVIDFDAAVRDPKAPQNMLAKYASADHLHPNDAGYAAMAAAINLKLFRNK